MKKWLVAPVILGLMLLAWFLFVRSNTRTAENVLFQKSAERQDAAVAKALATASPQVNAVINSNFTTAPAPQTILYPVPPKSPVASAGEPQPLEYTNLAPDIVLDNVRHAIHDYGAMFGGNPVGINSEITSQLNGGNPKQVNFIQADAGMRINEKGELVDPWGTPYFFHQLSGRETEIRSAGPDKIMWTADDLVTK
jgi:hypothetical protein